MKERPILFSSEMVRAILEGRKTQTRRIISPQPEDWELNDAFLQWKDRAPKTLSCMVELCPYGKPGDRLWVREKAKLTGISGFGGVDDTVHLSYAEPLPNGIYAGTFKRNDPGPFDYDKFTSPLFMPRWASRITLEITGVRVERLQEISEEDAVAEGIKRPEDITAKEADVYEGAEKVYFDALNQPLAVFRRLWDEINGKKAPWDSNPWVWVIEFKRVEAGSVQKAA